MDDFVLFHRKKAWLKDALFSIENFVNDELKLDLKPVLFNQTNRGLPFCGYVIYLYYIRLSQRSKKRHIKKVKYIDQQYHSKNWNESYCQRCVNSVIAFTQHADAGEFRKAVWNKYKPSI